MKRIILAITLISMMLITGVVYALSPILDGDDSGDWGVNPTTCTIGNAGCSRILDDPQDIGVGNEHYDVQFVMMTNSSTELFFRVDFYGNGTDPINSWEPTGGGNTPTLNICLDIDNNNSTGANVNAGICDGNEAMAGADYRINIVPDLGAFGQPSPPRLHTCTNPFCLNQTATGAIAYNSALPGGDGDTITEIRISLADVGIGGPTCPGGGPQPCVVEVGLYYDNGVAPLDDSIPEVGFTTGLIGAGSPTAVRLQKGGVGSAPTMLPLVVILGAVLLAVVSVVIAQRRQSAPG